MLARLTWTLFLAASVHGLVWKTFKIVLQGSLRLDDPLYPAVRLLTVNADNPGNIYATLYDDGRKPTSYGASNKNIAIVNHGFDSKSLQYKLEISTSATIAQDNTCCQAANLAANFVLSVNDDVESKGAHLVFETFCTGSKPWCDIKPTIRVYAAEDDGTTATPI
ncbi:uncharacterized protein L969DRAFT_237637 [Mixia osmundae IAM 14324]|uniref:Uncharacterized protein n=1 Tax=Mixia osmundae (strain CBS 9802 / IAM 14324 / JCM 22182 / KY 12970) TaxID=764103 RepID=G7E2I0_MIXOS|nr:uncharacterized protein L969DRAFT_237637 [Mixia osmundae IAM 14324]KEI36912.1 hypothetical protein L969DRAFT_237637 [Mixia osmundae IAM 14324]GAA97040.1 hypothetical protein E5Q_03715 [Mixia osmundae IAM 14324]